MKQDALLIFIRNPELGKVKTRLAKDLGDEAALGIYHQLLGHTRRIALSVPVERYLFYSNFIDRKDGWPEPDFKKYLQPPGDLGDRMLKAFDQALADCEAAVIVGSDCPGLSTDILQTAFTQLQQNDFVIGPALDGGYYLLGMKKLAPQLFLDMTWSTDQVFSDTTARMEHLGASYYVLPALSDIDYAEDWEQHGPLIDRE
ncbi:TIGR04282 family arsenosugar biosynthesis glycosyltransferase [Flavilitoribacter nigricans]|uniref:Glycosyltransferase n=1 Tax=Flavilitoribacter nigricans (strain ATCC 23147 / DSM 23189 / NBRC 102662 / NCIMB 1420 / SS-2) TaxID=1122177 RepID=A0A2D0N088_FLAN2|nr:TIGR04282 family arsenosugar biosynthesis glycosyltransferase [Flavilitoribacter nigricans]PHN01924.1 glycosyltransferase [Flavilitoribacter nigricans DSM 23189 = NBRC 102662]